MPEIPRVLKICYISFSSFPQIGAMAVYQYSCQLAKLGADITVISIGKPTEKRYEVTEGVKVHRVPFRRLKNIGPVSTWLIDSFRFAILASRHLHRISRKARFDIIHVISLTGASLIPLISDKDKGARWIYEVRTGPIKKGIGEFLTKMISRFDSQFFDTVIVISHEVNKRVFGNRKLKNSFIVPIGADFRFFKPQKNTFVRQRYDIKDTELLIIFVGTLHPNRNLHNILYGFKEALKEIKNLKLMFVGDGPYREQLDTLSKQLNLNKEIVFTGYVNYKDVPNYINSADIGISYVPKTAQYDAQPPLKTVEFLACGLPTIATNTMGNRSFIEDGYNGLLVNDDAESLSKAIIKLVKDAALRTKLANVSRKSVIEYDWKKIVQKDLVSTYHQVLSKK